MQRTQLNIVATLETSVRRLPSNLEAERSILGAVLPLIIMHSMMRRNIFGQKIFLSIPTAGFIRG